MRKLGTQGRKALYDALDCTLSDGISEAVRLSSGPYSSKQLARMDHPYAKRHGQPLLQPEYIINTQSGVFRASWTRSNVFQSGDTYWGFLSNYSGVADFLAKGTRFMFARPIDKILEIRMEARLAKELEKRLARLGI